MADIVTNIEGFEIINGPIYFATDLLTSGGVIATTAGALARFGAGNALLSFGQGWCDIPMGFLGDGRPIVGGLISFVAAITRVYIAPFIFLPAIPYSVMAHVFSVGPVYRARVELDGAGRLTLNGVMSGAPTLLVPGTYYRLELLTDVINGITELWVDGILEVQILAPTGAVDYVQLGDERVGANGAFTYDDLLVEASRTNPGDIDFPGDGRVERYIPGANGTDNAWINFGGPNKSASVSEAFPDGDVTYIHNNTAVADQTLALWTRTTAPFGSPSASLGVGEGVRALKVGTITRTTGANTGWRNVRIRSAATVDETDLFSHNAIVYQQYGQKCYQTDPDTGAPWTGVAADALEAGLGIDNVAMGRCTNLILQIERGIPFPRGRAKMNPTQLGGPVTMINPPVLGG